MLATHIKFVHLVPSDDMEGITIAIVYLIMTLSSVLIDIHSKLFAGKPDAAASRGARSDKSSTDEQLPR